MARLQILLPDAPAIDRELFDEPMTIGRVADNILQIEEGSISSHHAELIPQDTGGFLLRDLDSTNGTFVNEEPVQEVLLNDGDAIRFGKVEARFYAQNLPIDVSGGGENHFSGASSEVGQLFAQVSIRPIDFKNSSPFPKTESTKDPLRMAALGVGALALLAALVAIGATLTLMELPSFPSP